jgi:D-serine deaminase-like pyridoxal phosphate-dependent protein
MFNLNQNNMSSEIQPWYEVQNSNEISSPALIVYPDRIEENIRRMIAIAGNADRLRPHVKTHKMAELVKLQMKFGIQKFKCSTIAEVELVASCGAKDILLAMQPVGPAIRRLFEIKKQFPQSVISAIVDSEKIINEISSYGQKAGMEMNLWLDIDIGMNRTGISPGKEAIGLYDLIARTDSVKIAGLHVYDGHNHIPDQAERKKIFDECLKNIDDLAKAIVGAGHSYPTIIAGGTPTFPYFAKYKDMELSPGTLIFWDQGYSESFTDMDFLHAAVLLMRIVSKPGKNLLCLDLGTKAVASEMPHPRVKILGLDNYKIKSHFEEHLVIEYPDADKFKPGDIFYGIPVHICPTVARYESVSAVRKNIYIGQWQVEARNRKLTI